MFGRKWKNGGAATALLTGLWLAPLAGAQDAGAAQSVGLAKRQEPASKNQPPTTGTADESRLQELRDSLRQQQRRIEALESELRQLRTSAVVDSPPKPPEQAQQKNLEEKVQKLESRLKNVGPFSFSGDIRLRGEPIFGGPADQSQVRSRLRFRLRFNADAKLNDQISGGFALASGDLNDPISTNQTFNQFYTRKPFAIDRAFLTYTPSSFKALTLSGCSNVSQHHAEVLYQAHKNVQLVFTGYIGRPLNVAPTEDWLKRLQFDAIYKF